jgi:hypothetical protein
MMVGVILLIISLLVLSTCLVLIVKVLSSLLKGNEVKLKSEAIESARRCWSSRLTGWWTRKEKLEKMEGQGGGKAQGVTAPHPHPKKRSN